MDGVVLASSLHQGTQYKVTKGLRKMQRAKHLSIRNLGGQSADRQHPGGLPEAEF